MQAQAGRVAGMAELRRVGDRGGFEAWEIDLHGHQVVYRIAGAGPPVVLDEAAWHVLLRRRATARPRAA